MSVLLLFSCGSATDSVDIVEVTLDKIHHNIIPEDVAESDMMVGKWQLSAWQ